MKDLLSRLGVSFVLFGAAIALSRVQLPLFDLSFLNGEIVDVELFSPLSLGFNSYFTAALLVEVAALLVPRWRVLRSEDVGREKLSKASLVLAGIFFAVQAVIFVRYTMTMPIDPSHAVIRGGAAGTVAAACVLTFAPMVFLLVARKLDARMLLGAMPWLFIAELVIRSRGEITELADVMPLYGPLPLALFVAACVLLVINARAPRLVQEQHVPMPAVGVMPLSWAISLVIGMREFDRSTHFGVFQIDDFNTELRIGMVLLPVVIVFCTTLYTTRPTLAAWKHGNDERKFVQACALGITKSLLPLALAVYAQSQTRGVLLASAFVMAALLIAFVIDALHEIRQRLIASDWECATTVTRVMEADALRAALSAEGFDVMVRGRALRSLFHFFAPYFPIELHVPAEDRDEARAFAEAWLNDARAIS